MSLHTVDPCAPLPEVRDEFPTCPPSLIPSPVSPPREVEEVPEYTMEELQAEGVEKFTQLVMDARMARLGPFVAHLKHSNFDWSLSLEDLTNGRCLVRDIPCKGIRRMRTTNLLEHFHMKRHLKWDNEQQEMSVRESKSPSSASPTSSMGPAADPAPDSKMMEDESASTTDRAFHAWLEDDYIPAIKEESPVSINVEYEEEVLALSGSEYSPSSMEECLSSVEDGDTFTSKREFPASIEVDESWTPEGERLGSLNYPQSSPTDTPFCPSPSNKFSIMEDEDAAAATEELMASIGTIRHVSNGITTASKFSVSEKQELRSIEKPVGVSCAGPSPPSKFIITVEGDAAAAADEFLASMEALRCSMGGIPVAPEFPVIGNEVTSATEGHVEVTRAHLIPPSRFIITEDEGAAAAGHEFLTSMKSLRNSMGVLCTPPRFLNGKNIDAIAVEEQLAFARTRPPSPSKFTIMEDEDAAAAADELLTLLGPLQDSTKGTLNKRKRVNSK